MVMHTSHECICCCEVERVVMKKEESADEISCIANPITKLSPVTRLLLILVQNVCQCCEMLPRMISGIRRNLGND